MLPCLDSDLAVIFGTDDFGEVVVLDGVQITGHFDDEDIEANMGEGPTQIVPQPKFTCPSSAVPDLEEDQVLVRASSRNYLVKNWKNDGVGVIIIYLERT
jgi:hypothetical protein